MVQAPPVQASKQVTLIAPISGFLLPIDQVPDPVFAEKMVGDGISIDPSSEVLRAPCDGVVIQIHSSNHAVTLKTEDGIEVLMHIGLDTVMLKGEGFTPKVKMGDRVQTGDVLIEFDADFVALNAKSLLTQIVITNMEQVGSLSPCTGRVTVGQDPVLDIVIEETSPSASEEVPGETVVSEPITIQIGRASCWERV